MKKYIFPLQRLVFTTLFLTLSYFGYSQTLNPGRIAGGESAGYGKERKPILSMEPASGGVAPITYSWVQERNGTTWEWKSNTANISPGRLTATTKYQRKATSADGQVAYSNTITIDVKPLPVSWNIDAASWGEMYINQQGGTEQYYLDYSCNGGQCGFENADFYAYSDEIDSYDIDFDIESWNTLYIHFPPNNSREERRGTVCLIEYNTDIESCFEFYQEPLPFEFNPGSIYSPIYVVRKGERVTFQTTPASGRTDVYYEWECNVEYPYSAYCQGKWETCGYGANFTSNSLDYKTRYRRIAVSSGIRVASNEIQIDVYSPPCSMYTTKTEAEKVNQVGGRYTWALRTVNHGLPCDLRGGSYTLSSSHHSSVNFQVSYNSVSIDVPANESQNKINGTFTLREAITGQEIELYFEQPGAINPGLIGGDQYLEYMAKPNILMSIEDAFCETGKVNYSWEANSGSGWYSAYETNASYTTEYAPDATTRYRRAASMTGFQTVYSNEVTIRRPQAMCSNWTIDFSHLSYDNYIEIDQSGALCDFTIELHGSNCSNCINGGDFQVYSSYHDQWELDFYIDWNYINTYIPPNNTTEWIDGSICIYENITGNEECVDFRQAPLRAPFNPGSISGDQRVPRGTQARAIVNEKWASGGNGNITYYWEYLVETGESKLSDVGNYQWRRDYSASGDKYTPIISNYNIKYRRVASSNAGVLYSNEILIEVVQPPCELYTSGDTIEVNKDGGKNYSWPLWSRGNSIQCSNSVDGGSYTITSSYHPLGYAKVLSSRLFVDIPANTTNDEIVGYYTVQETYTGQELKLYFRQHAGTMLTGGEILGDNQNISVNDPVSTFENMKGARGGLEPIVYYWEFMTEEDSVWYRISGVNSESYQPKTPMVTTHYRRVATSGDEVAYSNVVRVTLPPLPCTFWFPEKVIVPRTGGWYNIPMSVMDPYDGSCSTSPWDGLYNVTSDELPNIRYSVTYDYMRVYFPSNGECNSFVGMIKFEELRSGQVIEFEFEQQGKYEAFTAGTIRGPQTIAYGAQGTIENVEYAEYTDEKQPSYQWEKSIGNGWQDIPNANNFNYSVSECTYPLPTRYRRKAIVTDGDCGIVTTYSNSVYVSFLPPNYTELQHVNGEYAYTIPRRDGWYKLKFDAEGLFGRNAWLSEQSFVMSVEGDAIISNTEYYMDYDGLIVKAGRPGLQVKEANLIFNINGLNIQIIQDSVPLFPGEISGNQLIEYGESSAMLMSVTDATCGDIEPGYQWEKNSGQGWGSIQGATRASYTPDPTIIGTAAYRRMAYYVDLKVYSNEVTVTILPTLVPGTIQFNTYSIAYGKPLLIGSSADATGGDGNITYTWEQSFNGSTWQVIPNMEGSDCEPSRPMVKTYYRRVVHSAGYTKYSNVLQFSSIPEPICFVSNVSFNKKISGYGGTGIPMYFTFGGSDRDCLTSLAGAYLNITATGHGQIQIVELNSNYAHVIFPPNMDRKNKLEGTISIVDERTNQRWSLPFVQDIIPPLGGGEISGEQVITFGSAPTMLKNISIATYGIGEASYQWQYTFDDENWYDVAEATSLEYTPSRPDNTIRYRRRVVKGDETAYSNIVTITVPPPPCRPSIPYKDRVLISHYGGWHTWALNAGSYGEACADSTQGGIYTITSDIHSSFDYKVDTGGISINIPKNPTTGSIFGTFTLREERTGVEVKLPFEQRGPLNAGIITAGTDNDTVIVPYGSNFTIESVIEGYGGTLDELVYAWIRDTTIHYSGWSYTVRDVDHRNTPHYYCHSIKEPKTYERITSRGYYQVYSNKVIIIPELPVCRLYLHDEPSKKFIAQQGGLHTWYIKADGDDCFEDITKGQYEITSDHHSSIEAYVDEYGLRVIFPPNETLKPRLGTITLLEKGTGQTLLLHYEQYCEEMPLLGGIIVGNQNLDYGIEPTWIRNEEHAKGGIATIQYGWERSVDSGINWVRIDGAKGESFLPSYPYKTRMYRRVAYSHSSVAYSNVVTLSVSPAPGRISFPASHVELEQRGNWYNWNVQFENGGDIKGAYFDITASVHGQLGFYVDRSGLNVYVPANDGYFSIEGTISVRDLQNPNHVAQFTFTQPPLRNTNETSGLNGGEITIYKKISLFWGAAIAIYNSSLAKSPSWTDEITYSWEHKTEWSGWLPIPNANDKQCVIYPPMEITKYRRAASIRGYMFYSNEIEAYLPDPPRGLYSTLSDTIVISQSGGVVDLRPYIKDRYSTDANKHGYYSCTSSYHEDLPIDKECPGVRLNIPANSGLEPIRGEFTVFESRTGQSLRFPFIQKGFEEEEPPIPSEPLTPGEISGPQMVAYGGSPRIISIKDATGDYKEYVWRIREVNKTSSRLYHDYPELTSPPIYSTTRFERCVDQGSKCVYFTVTVPPPPCDLYSLDKLLLFEHQGGNYRINLSTRGDFREDCSNSSILGGDYVVTSSIHGRLEHSLDSAGLDIRIPANEGDTWIVGTLTVRDNLTGQEVEVPFEQYAGIYNPLDGGHISGNQFIAYGNLPATLSSEVEAAGGAGPINYKWQYSVDGGSWSDLVGFTDANCNAPRPNSSSWYRRVAMSARDIAYSNEVRIELYNPPCELEMPDTMVIIPQSGGEYCWTISIKGQVIGDACGGVIGGFFKLNSTHHDSLIYYVDSIGVHVSLPPNNSSEALFGMFTITEERTKQVFNIEFEQYKVETTFTSGSISGDQSIEYGNPLNTLLSIADASGGRGYIRYQWELSTDGEMWQEIVGATEANYHPAYPTSIVTYYRRSATSADILGYSNAVAVNMPLPPCGIDMPYSSVEIEQAGGWKNWMLESAGSGSSCINDIAGGYYTVISDKHGELFSYTNSDGIHILMPPNSTMETIFGEFTIREERTQSVFTLPFRQHPMHIQFTAGMIAGEQHVGLGFQPKTLSSVIDASGASGAISYRWEYSYNGKDWYTVQGAVGVEYTPSNITSSTKYRRVAMLDGMLLYSNVVTITVLEQATPLNKGENYMIAYTPRVETKSKINITDPIHNPSISYYDGLGRPRQTNIRGGGTNRSDLVQYQEYDKFGRVSATWNQIAYSAGGKSIGISQVREAARKGYKDGKAYSVTELEASPLARPIKQFGAGEDWYSKNKAVTTQYLTNSGGTELSALYFSVTPSGALKNNGNYPAQTLTVTMVVNEDGAKSWEFVDKLNQVILRRALNDGEYYDTYYVYDTESNLRYVLPPIAVNELMGVSEISLGSDNVLDKYAYIYTYDHRFRCVEKKLPGVESVYFTYDWLDRVSAMQDGNMRAKGQWVFTVYDELGRVGKQVLSASSDFDFEYNSRGDSISRYPVGAEQRILSQNFYDNHSFTPDNNLNYNSNIKGFGQQHPNQKGLLTGTAIYVDSLNNVLYAAMYYDDKGRVVQSHMQNHLGGYDYHYYAHNFAGEIVHYKHEHTVQGGAFLTEGYLYEYDHVGRQLSVKHYLDNESNVVTITQNTYDELGRLVGKDQGRGAVNMSYTYNVRNWLSKAEGAHFTQQLYYQDLPQSINGTPSYSGNISAMQWSTSDNVKRGYAFSYDQINRLTHAAYGEGDVLTINAGRYDERFKYDAQGNPLELTRWGVRSKLGEHEYGVIDYLQYEYNGNKMLSVVDTAENLIYYGAADFAYPEGADLVSEHYRYDANGNPVFDLNKGVTGIVYDYQNQPREVNFEVGHKMSYIYNSAGERLRMTSMTNTQASNLPLTGTDNANLESVEYEVSVTDYVGNLVYKDGRLQMLITEEGYVEFDSTGSYTYNYYVKDHLGNNRVVVGEGGDVVQTNHYYAFGMEFNEEDQQMKNEQPYKFGGKVEQSMHRLNLYDFHARQYDPATIRFLSIDPMIEKHYEYTGYAYVYNNPIRLVDPLGLDSVDAAALQTAAQNAVAFVNKNYGKTDAYCNQGVNYAFVELTGNTKLSNKSANAMIEAMEKDLKDDFEPIVDMKNVQTGANDGDIIIAGSKGKGTNSGHVVLIVPGEEHASGTWKENVPVGMDTGRKKRWTKKTISESWTANEKGDVKFYKYTGVRTGTTDNRLYRGGEISSVVVVPTSKVKSPHIKPIAINKVK